MGHCCKITALYRGIAQSGRALRSGRRGRRFESCYPDQFLWNNQGKINHMDNEDIVLETKFVGDINGKFFIPSYQRGYRWEKQEVERLLEDIYITKGQRNYCLQPIVVKVIDKAGAVYELIDGQQRLTTIYLIYRYMHEAVPGFIEEPGFSLSYETREKSEDFLRSIDDSKKEDNIDFWFIAQAYETIKNWFAKKEELYNEKKSVLMSKMNTYFSETVKVIWYEVGESENAIDLFKRLNIGKIPLTSSELVKSIFLSKNAKLKSAGFEKNAEELDAKAKETIIKEKQEEIALQWDNIEKELHNDSLWFFLTNNRTEKYQTRIDLILDLIAEKPVDTREKYFTFFYFDNKSKESLEDIWREIQQTFLMLKGWYENHTMYHKVGYLIASESNTLQEIYNASKNKTKQEFDEELDRFIKQSVAFDGDYSKLNYGSDYDKIKKILLLFNVESVRRIDGQSARFPFDKYKFDADGKVVWSLEHIHAQNSEGMKTQESWKEWLKLHIPSVKAVSKDSTDLISRMEAAINNKKLEGWEFEALRQEVLPLFSPDEESYRDSIANMALLNTRDNSALNNSVFDVKRNQIIKMDKEGRYIPFCTKMVFLKYYTKSDEQSVWFWGHQDREAYIKAINEVLATNPKYIEPIVLQPQTDSDKKEN